MRGVSAGRAGVFSAVVRRAGVGSEHTMYVPSRLDNDFLPARAVTGQDV